MRNALNEFNFDETLQGEFKNSLSQVPWLGVGNVRVIKEVTVPGLDQALTDSKAGAVLFTDTDYHLSNDGDVLSITVKASLFANNDMLRALKKPKTGAKAAVENSLYHNNTLTFETRAPNATSDRDRNIATWSADNGAAFRSAVKTGAVRLARMLADDLQRSEAGPAKKVAGKGAGAVKGAGVSGETISSDDDGTVVRLSDGTLKFVTKSALLP